MIENGELAIANPEYTLNMTDAKNSVMKLLGYEIDTIICYHGGIYNKDIKSSLSKVITG